MSKSDQPNSPRHAHLQAQWQPGQKWETLVDGATVWVPVSDGGYREPTWDHHQEYRMVDPVDEQVSDGWGDDDPRVVAAPARVPAVQAPSLTEEEREHIHAAIEMLGDYEATARENGNDSIAAGAGATRYVLAKLFRFLPGRNAGAVGSSNDQQEQPR